jgi:mRNA interferase RelE/StbE
VKLAYKKRAVKDIKAVSPELKERLKYKLEWFASQPDPLSFAEPLTKPADAQYRYRVGNYRVLFDVDHDTIIVLRVQHRREVYRK